MTQLASEIFSSALRLNESERAEVAAKLLDSIDSDADADADAAWSAEIHQRLEQIRSGAVKTIPWSEARQAILDDSDESDAD